MFPNHGRATRRSVVSPGNDLKAWTLARRVSLRRDFLVDCRPQAGIRISPHIYTEDEETGINRSWSCPNLRTKAYERRALPGTRARVM